MKVRELKAEYLDTERFIREKIKEIKNVVGGKKAICALSGGVDSATTAVLGHKALGDSLKIIFVDNGLMRKVDFEIITLFEKATGIPVSCVDARNDFFQALEGQTYFRDKRVNGITETFYLKVLARVAGLQGADFVLHGSIYTDKEETDRGIKPQHNIFGPEYLEESGYQAIEPLIQLRKDGVRKIAKVLGLPDEICFRMPFPGPALACRVLGEVTLERVEVARKADVILEGILGDFIKQNVLDVFQYMAILHHHDEIVPGIRDGKPVEGNVLEISCWNSKDATKADPTPLPHNFLNVLANYIVLQISEITRVVYTIGSKPPLTMEAV